MTFAQHDGLDLWSRTVVATVRSDAPDLTARQQALLLTVALGKVYTLCAGWQSICASPNPPLRAG